MEKSEILTLKELVNLARNYFKDDHSEFQLAGVLSYASALLGVLQSGDMEAARRDLQKAKEYTQFTKGHVPALDAYLSLLEEEIEEGEKSARAV